MELIRSDLKKLGIKHNKFVSESEIVNKNLVNKDINEQKMITLKKVILIHLKVRMLKRKKLKTIFKSELFGDDTNRALQKNDGSWTYFANDVVSF